MEAEKLISAAPSLDAAVLTVKAGVAAAGAATVYNALLALPEALRFLAVWSVAAAGVFLGMRLMAALGGGQTPAGGAAAPAPAPAPPAEPATPGRPAQEAAEAAQGQAAAEQGQPDRGMQG